MLCPAQLIVAAVTDNLAVPKFENVRKLPAAEPQTKVMPGLVERKSPDLKDAVVRPAEGSPEVLPFNDSHSPTIARAVPQTTITITITTTALVTL